jgi:hypothetical protein
MCIFDGKRREIEGAHGESQKIVVMILAPACRRGFSPPRPKTALCSCLIYRGRCPIVPPQASSPALDP